MNAAWMNFLLTSLATRVFLQSALHRFTPQMQWRFFERLGLSLKTERGNRVFPQSDKAVDVVDAFVLI
jgi:predicted flavoprotein YhiN